MNILCFSFKGDCHDHGRKEIVSFLKQNHYDVIDLGKNVSYDTVYGACFIYDPDVLCISATLSSSYDMVIQYIRFLKKSFDCKIICGGIAFKEKEKDPAIDFISESKEDLIKILEDLNG